MSLAKTTHWLFALFACCFPGYSQNTGLSPSFEVASVKPSPPPQAGQPVSMYLLGGPGSPDPRLLRGENFSLCNLVERAYDVSAPYRIACSGWMESANFDILARVPENTTKEQFQLMLQSLLAERFGLKIHYEEKLMPGYRLVVAKDGPRLAPSVKEPVPGADDPKPADRVSAVPYGTPGRRIGPDGFPILLEGVMSAVVAGHVRTRWSDESMGRFAEDLSGRLRRPVEDATGLNGEYDFGLYYVTDCRDCSGNGEAASLPQSPTLIEAVQKQLGLKLESSPTTRVRVLVVDHAERAPTQN